MFQVGGVDVYVHKYIGPSTPDIDSATADKPHYDVVKETNIQDLLFLENRDRKYDPDIYVIRGHYQVQDTDFNLSQFGLFLQNDTIFMTIHINSSVDAIGRKIMSGDVIELPNLKDEYALNDFKTSLKRFYVVEDVNRAAEGFSATWYPHLYRLKLKPIVDSQEFKDILDRPEDEDSFRGDFETAVTYTVGQTVKYKGDLYECTAQVTGVAPPDNNYWQLYTKNNLRDLLSTYEQEMQINDAIVAQAEADAPASGFETSQFYTLSYDKDTAKPAIQTVDQNDIDATSSLPASRVNEQPVKEGYSGYLIGDGVPPNGEQFGFGIQFPRSAASGDYFLRTDYMPNRLFRYDGSRWIKFEDKVRMELSNTDTRQTHRLSFINNNQFNGVDRVITDIIEVGSSREPQFALNENTLDFQVSDSYVFVKTNLDYADTYKIEAWIDENTLARDITLENTQGKLSFKINSYILENSRIRYTVYTNIVEQRQATSKALKKIQAEVDE
jgi:hypothetical protein